MGDELRMGRQPSPTQPKSFSGRIQGLGFRVWGSGLRGLGFRIQGLGFRVQAFRVCGNVALVFGFIRGASAGFPPQSSCVEVGHKVEKKLFCSCPLGSTVP